MSSSFSTISRRIRRQRSQTSTVTVNRPPPVRCTLPSANQLATPMYSRQSLLEESNNLRAGVLPFFRDDSIWLLVGKKMFKGSKIWTDFGGYPNPGETTFETAKREVTEEFGKPIDGMYTTHHTTAGMKLGAANVRYQCVFMLEVPTKNIIRQFVPTDEIFEIRWITFDEFQNINPVEMSRSLRFLRESFTDGDEWRTV